MNIRQQQLQIDRLRGEGRHRIDYRHVIWSLVKKPWAFARYLYRDSLFPAPLWEKALTALVAQLPERQAEMEYLRVLHLAAATLQHEVEAAIELLLGQEKLPIFTEVRALVSNRKPEVPELAPFTVDLADYDELLVAEVGS